MKLATELYDSDDAVPSRTPPLVARDVKLQPSPSPEYPSPPPQSPSPELSTTSKRRGRKRRTQPSQSDGVLIGVLGDHNNPEIAAQAAELPLNSASQSEAGDSDVAMEEVEEGGAVAERNLAQVAQDAINEVRGRSCSPRTEGARRIRPPKLQTVALESQMRRLSPSGHTKREEWREASKERPDLHHPTGDLSHSIKPEKASLPAIVSAPSQGDFHFRRHGSNPTAISPELRKHTIALSEGSPMETLPAIQHSPSLNPGKSANHQQNLPSLQHLALPLDPRSPQDNDLRSLGVSQRHTFPMQSPSAGSLTSRATFPSSQTRINGLPRPYPPSHPSPASTYSETSPRDTYRQSLDATSLSPPGKPERQFYASGRTLQSDELTPASSESHASTTNSAEAPLSAENMSVDGPRPILPPLLSEGYTGGIYRCDFPGCTAVPFQTQYLLK